jgi:NADH:ubiquinone oxidoreductase subunit B-like Fe-S oxidoreductase
VLEENKKTVISCRSGVLVAILWLMRKSLFLFHFCLPCQQVEITAERREGTFLLDGTLLTWAKMI